MPRTIMIPQTSNITYLLQRYAEESGFQTISANQGKKSEFGQHTQPALFILHAHARSAITRYARLESRTETRIPIVLYSG